MSIYCTTTGRFLQQGNKVRDRLFYFCFCFDPYKNSLFWIWVPQSSSWPRRKFTASMAVPSQGKQYTQSRLLSRAGWVQCSGNRTSGSILNGKNVFLIMCCWLFTILLTTFSFHSSCSFLPIFVSSDSPKGILWWLIVRLARYVALIPLPFVNYNAHSTRSLLSPSFLAVFLFPLFSPLCCWFLCLMVVFLPSFLRRLFLFLAPIPVFFAISFFLGFFLVPLFWWLLCLPLFPTSIALFLPPRCCFFLSIPSVYRFISCPFYYHWFNSVFFVVADCHVLFSRAWHQHLATTMDTCVATIDTCVATIDTCVK